MAILKRHLLPLALVLLLCAAMILPVSADVWIPPDNDCNFYLMELPHLEESCRPLNVFLSNYCEANVTYYDLDLSPDSDAIAGLLKHFELNPLAYPGEVWQETRDGVSYMAITASRFEESMQALYGRFIDASLCPGYENGTIYVTADNYSAPVTEFASAVSCTYLGDHTYQATFDVYRAHSGFSEKYATCNSDLPADKVTYLGEGTATFSFYGNNATDEFSPRDFTLLTYEQTADGISYTNANQPYASAPAVTEAATDATQASTAAPVAQAPSEALPDTSQAADDAKLELGSPTHSDGSDKTVIILLIVLVAVIAAAALVIILLLVKKNKKTPPHQR